jgi:hypothetical protein
MADEVTLSLGTTHFGKHLQLANAFYAFSDHVETKRITHGDDGANKRSSTQVISHTIDE